MIRNASSAVDQFLERRSVKALGAHTSMQSSPFEEEQTCASSVQPRTDALRREFFQQVWVLPLQVEGAVAEKIGS